MRCKNETLSRSFYRRDAVQVARGLLGQRLVRIRDGTRISGIIVETEAYLGVIDKAAHSFGGRRTRRTETMYADGGTAYVYFTYGMHYLFNVVTGKCDQPTAVLVRGLQPVEGLELMFDRRKGVKVESGLCSGPARLTMALEIGRPHDGLDLVTSDELFIERARRRPLADSKITVTPRVGIDYAEDWVSAPLRFFLSGNPHVSKARFPS